MSIKEIIQKISSSFGTDIQIKSGKNKIDLFCENDNLVSLSDWIFNSQNCTFSGLVVEELEKQWKMVYIFNSECGYYKIYINILSPIENNKFPSISMKVHAADWFEREAEDMFGLVFDGHPRLGDFILHDEVWREGLEPMRKKFKFSESMKKNSDEYNYTFNKVAQMPGVFVMPVGPVFSGVTESVHFRLETIGEEIIRVYPRLSYKFRGVEKIVQGHLIEDAVIFAERYSGINAFSNALGYCLAIESLADCDITKRAKLLRIFLAEVERFRHHLGVIEGICSSTGLSVASNQVAIMEEKVLRISGMLTGHRYMFGMVVPGGLSKDLDNAVLKLAVERLEDISLELKKIERLMNHTGSFLDRLEEVGIISNEQVHDYGIVGPVARSSGTNFDVRKNMPYCGYENFELNIQKETEGDCYARLRVFLHEAYESVNIIKQILPVLPEDKVKVSCNLISGIAISTIETPKGSVENWIRINDDKKIDRYRVITPSFKNWHGYHLAAENFAFQDFPIILSTFGFSVAENDM